MKSLKEESTKSEFQWISITATTVACFAILIGFLVIYGIKYDPDYVATEAPEPDEPVEPVEPVEPDEPAQPVNNKNPYEINEISSNMKIQQIRLVILDLSYN